MAAKPRRRCRETARSYGGCTHPNRPARRTPPMTTSSVSATGLVKAFGEFRAVDRIDLEVRQGEIFGVLGPNGAGKTTMLRMLATLLPIDAGQAQIFGVDVAREQHRVRQLGGVTGAVRLGRRGLDRHRELWAVRPVAGPAVGGGPRQRREPARAVRPGGGR